MAGQKLLATHSDALLSHQNGPSRNLPVSKLSMIMPLAKRKRLAGGNGSLVPNIASLSYKAGLLNFPKDGPSACRLGLKLEQAGADKRTPLPMAILLTLVTSLSRLPAS